MGLQNIPCSLDFGKFQFDRACSARRAEPVQAEPHGDGIACQRHFNGLACEFFSLAIKQRLEAIDPDTTIF